MKWALFAAAVVAVILAMFFVAGLFKTDIGKVTGMAQGAGEKVRDATGV